MSDTTCNPDHHDELLKLKERTLAHGELLTDHEKRLRWIERIAGYGVGAVGAAKLLFDLFHK